MIAVTKSENLAVYGDDFPPFRSVLISTYGYHDLTLADPNYIADHVARALDLLIEQFEHTHEPY